MARLAQPTTPPSVWHKGREKPPFILQCRRRRLPTDSWHPVSSPITGSERLQLIHEGGKTRTGAKKSSWSWEFCWLDVHWQSGLTAAADSHKLCSLCSCFPFFWFLFFYAYLTKKHQIQRCDFISPHFYDDTNVPVEAPPSLGNVQEVKMDDEWLGLDLAWLNAGASRRKQFGVRWSRI